MDSLSCGLLILLKPTKIAARRVLVCTQITPNHPRFAHPQRVGPDSHYRLRRIRFTHTQLRSTLRARHRLETSRTVFRVVLLSSPTEVLHGVDPGNSLGFTRG
ncbi:hypothetical protein K438DRAFT_308598 [Mycena galopus ATCC 62051]|nr:hypothetical protein K438DRAFT_308598 [Mycena galopus ATCC 62051]